MTPPASAPHRADFVVELDLPGGGLRLAARRIGAIAGPGPVLVFLHEALGSIGQWKGLPEELAERTGLPAL
ncbi:MAG: alpha/beta hydrolase, partial [Bacteroidota bacterium]